jgi:hypothetical protein
MDVVLKEFNSQECWIFLDYIIIFSDTVEEHARSQEHVFQIREIETFARTCEMRFREIRSSVLKVTCDSRRDSRVFRQSEAVREYPKPKNEKDIRAFLGLKSVYRRLIPKFSEIAKPLAELTRKVVPFSWDARQQAASKKLKETLCSSDVLEYPDFDSEFIVTTDASRVAVAAVISQVQNGKLRSLSFASRQMNRAEQNYSASQLEMLGVVWALRYYRFYPYGRHFLVRTDLRRVNVTAYVLWEHCEVTSMETKAG